MNRFDVRTQDGKNEIVGGRTMAVDRGIVVIFDERGNFCAAFAHPQSVVKMKEETDAR